MVQLAIRSGAPANQERGKSLGCWNREDHIRHRDYLPTLRRFIERDPIGFEAGDGNWYRFVANGPTAKSDPSGLCSCPDSSIEIVVQAYIPYDRISGPDGFWYGGDGFRRGLDATPGAEDDDYRIRLHYFNGRMKTDAGITRQFRDETSPLPIRQAEDKEGAQMRHKAFEWSFASRHYYRVEGTGKNPLIGLPLNPAINYAFTILQDGCSRTVSIDTGRHDGFPSYEVFVRLPDKKWVNLYHHDARKENQTIWSLFGRGEYQIRNTKPVVLD